MSLVPFHLAVPVSNLNAARKFYRETLGLEEGRSDAHWVDFNMYGHQFVIHEVEQIKAAPGFGKVDNHNVPVPHFGLILDWEDWEILAKRLTNLNISFEIKPYIRFEGLVGEQATMFFYDPSGNALEFKAFRNPDQIFQK